MQIDIKYIYNTLQIASRKFIYFLYSLKKLRNVCRDAFKSSVCFNYDN